MHFGQYTYKYTYIYIYMFFLFLYHFINIFIFYTYFEHPLRTPFISTFTKTFADTLLGSPTSWVPSGSIIRTHHEHLYEHPSEHLYRGAMFFFRLTSNSWMHIITNILLSLYIRMYIYIHLYKYIYIYGVYSVNDATWRSSVSVEGSTRIRV